MNVPYRFFSKRTFINISAGLITALIGADIAHRYRKPDLTIPEFKEKEEKVEN
jgi:hypothetical protein